MSIIVVFSGTTEGRSFSEGLSDRKIAHHVCVATEYGELVMKDSKYVNLHVGRLTGEEMESFFCGLKKEDEDVTVYDATHPYAKEVTVNIREAAEKSECGYIRILRQSTEVDDACDTCYVEDAKAAAEALLGMPGNILLTTGSKELQVFASHEELLPRLYARVLPSVQSITLANDAGLSGKQVIAMHGPFSESMNLSMIRDYGIDVMVTKESGVTGGFPEKMSAAKQAGIRVIVIGRPADESGVSVGEALRTFGSADTSDCCATGAGSLKISLVGFGPGARSYMTLAAKFAVQDADVVFGAKRLVEEFPDKKTYPYYLAKDIIPVLSESLERSGRNTVRAAALFTGDSGYYSGAAKMKTALLDWLKETGIDGEVEIIPGISSVSLFAARIGEGYSDSMLMSIHGRSSEKGEIEKVFWNIRYNSKVFVLLSGVADARMLGEGILARKLDGCSVVLGSSLSYEDEEIKEYTPEELVKLEKEGLYIALVKNSKPQKLKVFNDISDDEYVRAKVPMTKEAIRHLSVVRLGLCEGDVMYDIGSGTGSIAVESASLHDTIKVYAIEKKPEALELIAQNAREQGCPNVIVVPGEAPEALEPLEAPDVAFIGGSSGQMKDILKLLRDKNPEVRVVVNAVSLETIAEIEQITKEFKLKDLVIEQLSVSRAKSLGSYHLMMAENPVFIAAFRFECE